MRTSAAAARVSVFTNSRGGGAPLNVLRAPDNKHVNCGFDRRRKRVVDTFTRESFRAGKGFGERERARRLGRTISSVAWKVTEVGGTITADVLFRSKAA